MTPPARRDVTRDVRVARVRITSLTVILVVVVLVVGMVAVLSYTRHQLVARADERLQSAVRAAETFRSSDLQVSPDTIDSPVQFIDEQGAVAFASRPLADDRALWGPGESRDPHTVRSESLGPTRIVVTRFPTGWLVMAESLGPIERDLRVLRNALLVALPIAAALTAGIVWVAVGRALRPVVAVRRREERLVADVSHELKSPIAGMRVLLETEADDPDEIVRNRRSTLTELSRLEVLTSRLLQLAAPADASSSIAPVDLDEVVLREATRYSDRSRVRIDTSAVEPGQVVGDQVAMESLVDNLLSNACRYARSAVVVTVTEHAGRVELIVEDDGPGIPPDEREAVFERFTRLDPSRSRADGGAGLGLAIARDVVEDHHGRIVVDASSLGGARVVVTVPASTRPPG